MSVRHLLCTALQVKRLSESSFTISYSLHFSQVPPFWPSALPQGTNLGNCTCVRIRTHMNNPCNRFEVFLLSSNDLLNNTRNRTVIWNTGFLKVAIFQSCLGNLLIISGMFDLMYTCRLHICVWSSNWGLDYEALSSAKFPLASIGVFSETASWSQFWINFWSSSIQFSWWDFCQIWL